MYDTNEKSGILSRVEAIAREKDDHLNGLKFLAARFYIILKKHNLVDNVSESLVLYSQNGRFKPDNFFLFVE